MDRPLLSDAAVYPAEELLTVVLGSCYEIYQMFTEQLSEYQIELEWNYYKDGKSWLGKAVSKKKTVFWLSVWQGFFKISFHFTERAATGVMQLDVPDELKERLKSAPLKGKLKSLQIDISEESQLRDVFRLAEYKKSI